MLTDNAKHKNVPSPLNLTRIFNRSHTQSKQARKQVNPSFLRSDFSAF